MTVGSTASLFKEAFSEFSEDKASRLGAALAYYTIFSLAPLLLIAIAVAGWFLGPDAAAGQVSGQLEGVLGLEGAQSIESMIAHADQTGSGLVAGIIGVVALLFGATGAFIQLQDALNTIWDVETEKTGIKGFVVNRLLSLSMILVIGFLLVVGLFANAFISGAAAHAQVVFPIPPAILYLINIVVQAGLFTLLFGAIFKILPDVNLAWRDVWFGAAATSLLFIIGQALIGWYLGSSAVGSAFGAAGSLVVVLVWVFYSAQLVLLGGELTHVYARRHGTRFTVSEGSAQVPAEDGVAAESARKGDGRGSFMPLVSGFVLGVLIGRKRS